VLGFLVLVDSFELKGLSILVVFFHQRRVPRFQLLSVDGWEVLEGLLELIQEGHEGLGSDQLGAFHFGVGIEGQLHSSLLSEAIGIEDSGGGRVTGVPEKPPSLVVDFDVEVPQPLKGFQKPPDDSSWARTGKEVIAQMQNAPK
jgi:hypothetical protein